jgi:putative ABC transport system substrate-binding protein
MGGAAAAWPVAARAQQPAIPVIGFLGSASAEAFAPLVRGFRKGLHEAGYIEGQNVSIEYRWADDQYERLPVMASDLVQRKVAVLLAGGPPAAVAAKAATATVPIIFIVGFDPIGAQLVNSLSRPGGNLTGMYLYIGGLVAKKLELLHEMAPNATTLALLVNPASPSAKLDATELEAAGRTRGLRIQILNAGTRTEIDTAFAGLAQRGIDAVLVGTDPFFFSQREQLVALAARHGMPMISYAREFVAAGGLMSYGVDIADTYRQGGSYVARVLKGEKPADLPVQQPTKFELVINLKAAKALGLNIPPSLLARADEVLE